MDAHADLPPQGLLNKVQELQGTYGVLDARSVLNELILYEFPGQIGVSSSFGAGAAIVLHMVSEINAYTPVVFFDTFKHFPETLAYRETLIQRLGLCNMQVVVPNRRIIEKRDPSGTLHVDDPDRCCHLRKVMPMNEVFGSQSAWITGRRSSQSERRAQLTMFEVQETWIKVNPLFNWRASDVDAYFRQHNLPEHPLKKRGFLSIGCAPCTRAVRMDQSERAGRWPDATKTECGLH